MGKAQSVDLDVFSHFFNQVTISDVERFHKTSQHSQQGSATLHTHLDKCGSGADAIECLRQRLIELANILVLKGFVFQSRRSVINIVWSYLEERLCLGPVFLL